MTVGHIIVEHWSGTTRRAVFRNFLHASLTLRRNVPASFTMDLSADHALFDATLARGDRFEVFRVVPGLLDKYRLATLFYGSRAFSYDGDVRVARVTGAGPLALLNRATVAYYTSVSDYGTFDSVAAETIAKTLVTTNLTASATTANGRFVTFPYGSLPVTISVAADEARGAVIGWEPALGGVADELPGIALAGGLDFEMRRDSDTAFTFRVASGTDRTNTLTFSRANGNLDNAELVERAEGRPTVALVLGPGTGASRDVSVVYSDDYSASNHTEIIAHSGARAQTASARQASGKAELERARRDSSALSFDIRQTAATMLDRDYAIGDTVAIRAHGVTETHKVAGATFVWSGQGSLPETIDVVTELA